MEKEELKHHMLILYTLRYLPQKEKVRVLRTLQGYREKKYGKLYKHDGLVHELNTKKLGSNVILAPIENFSRFENFFTENNIKIEAKEIWLR